MIEHHFLVPNEQVGHYLLDTIRVVPAFSSLEGCCAWVHFSNERDLVAAALVFGEMAKLFKNGLLICREDDDMEFEEKLGFLMDELCLKPLALRFIKYGASHSEMARLTAMMPSSPVPDPRPIWDAL